MKNKRKFLALILIFTPVLLNAQSFELYARKNFSMNGRKIPYRILYPDQFDASRKYPLVIMLHGAGERGNNNESQLIHGGNVFLKKEVRKKFSPIVVFPQCPTDSYWSNVDITGKGRRRTFVFREGGEPTEAMNLLIGLIGDLLKQPSTDTTRVYIGGLSMGGMGTFEILTRRPDWFAAAFVICGGGHPKTVGPFAKKVPVWVFHGAKDQIVPLQQSEIMVKALRVAGANPRFTVYPEADHDSWTAAFAEPELLPWLFSKYRK